MTDIRIAPIGGVVKERILSRANRRPARPVRGGRRRRKAHGGKIVIVITAAENGGALSSTFKTKFKNVVGLGRYL
jgi:hypothetical protein